MAIRCRARGFRFAVVSGSGTLAVEQAVKDLDGRASSRLTVGGVLGEITIEVTVTGMKHSLTFVVRALPSPDFDADGAIGFGDFLIFAGAFGKVSSSA